MPEPVPNDVAAEIRELANEGLGYNRISAATGVNSSTVKRVISGQHQSYSDQLSARQTQRLLTNWTVL